MSPVLLGLALGAVFGAAARAGGLCLLRGMKSARRGEFGPLRAFALALAVAICTTQGLARGVDLSAALPLRGGAWPGMFLGGAVFGLGMVLANACGARALVLAAGGNMRMVLVLLALGVSAQASMTGVLAPLRLWVQGLGTAQAGTLPLAAGLGLAVLLAAFALPLRNRTEAACATVIGLTIAAGWWVSHATDDPFDPRALTSLSFIGPVADGLLWLMLSTGRALNFGIAVVAGTVIGAFTIAALRRDLRLEPTGAQLPRALLGGLLMGFGGVLALGCSIGQGLSGISTLSLASLVAFSGILAGTAVALVFDPRKEPT
ncbi:YeeE/YedE thiosulfate transporter family protein [Paenirhodobacter sp.]|uniref:YeeE/YedE thiosulfate transporter family protein n=1 Tax=Paenirhodobacter sp. TaxID=1965326 RepID=UPI003B3C71C3